LAPKPASNTGWVCPPPGSPRVLVTDIVKPKMRGTELAKRLRSACPDLQVVDMSGYLEHNKGGADFLSEGVFLQKPFSRDTLVNKIGEALKQEPAASSPAR